MLVCLSEHHFHVWSPLRSEGGIGCPGTGIMDDCKPLTGCWELDLGPLLEQDVFLRAENWVPLAQCLS